MNAPDSTGPLRPRIRKYRPGRGGPGMKPTNSPRTSTSHTGRSDGGVGGCPCRAPSRCMVSRASRSVIREAMAVEALGRFSGIWASRSTAHWIASSWDSSTSWTQLASTVATPAGGDSSGVDILEGSPPDPPQPAKGVRTTATSNTTPADSQAASVLGRLSVGGSRPRCRFMTSGHPPAP